MPTPDQILLITTIVASKIGILLGVHFIADFIFQSDWMAVNKSKHILPLAIHCLIYASCFLWLGIIFFLAMFASHFITDYITSRVSHKLYQAGQRHWFFVAIGADQLIHSLTILVFLCYLT